MSESPVDVRVRLEGVQATLCTLARIYDIGQQLLNTRPRPSRVRAVEYGARMWVDLHIEALGWGLLAAVFAAVLLIAWIIR